MLDVTLDRCGDNGYIVVEDEVWMEKKWRSVIQQFDIWNMLLGLQSLWLLAMVGGQRLMKGKADLCKFRLILLTRHLLEFDVLNISRPFGIRVDRLGLRGGFIYRPASDRGN